MPYACHHSNTLPVALVCGVHATCAHAILDSYFFYWCVAAWRSGAFVPPWFAMLAATPSAAYPRTVYLVASDFSPVVQPTHPVATSSSALSLLDASFIGGAAASCCSVTASVVAAPLLCAEGYVRPSVMLCASVPPGHACMVQSTFSTTFVQPDFFETCLRSNSFPFCEIAILIQPESFLALNFSSLTSRALCVPSFTPVYPTPFISNPAPSPDPTPIHTSVTPGLLSDLNPTSSFSTVSIPLRLQVGSPPPAASPFPPRHSDGPVSLTFGAAAGIYCLHHCRRFHPSLPTHPLLSDPDGSLCWFLYVPASGAVVTFPAALPLSNPVVAIVCRMPFPLLLPSALPLLA